LTHIIYIETIERHEGAKPKTCRKPLRNQKNTHTQTAMDQNRLKTKGIFLDLDGTIVDSTEAYIEAAKIASRKAALSCPVLIAANKRVIAEMADISAARPSRPSRRLMAFVTPSIHT
jgi:hypothetical protein